MQNIAELLEQISLIAANPKSPGSTWFISLDLKYAYGQLPLNQETNKQCNFNIVCGKATGTNRFLMAFYGLNNTPAEFQRTMDAILLTLQNTFAFVDDIVIVTKGPLEEHMKQVYATLKVLDDENLAVAIDKSQIARCEID